MGRHTKPRPPACKDLEFLYSSSADGIDTSLLVLFHGLGDTPKNFHTFGLRLRLPQTAILSIRAPIPIPYHDGTGWYPSFTPDGDVFPEDHPLVRTTVVETRNKVDRLIDTCGWERDRIVLLGFAQGGECAVDVAAFGNSVVGGVVSIGGWPARGSHTSSSSSRRTSSHPPCDVLITQGDRSGDGWKDSLEHLQSLGVTPKVVVIPGKDQGMPSSEVEMRPIMTFLAGKLKQRNIALEDMSDVYEVSNVEKA
ncbi:hypothetical protein HKX48_006821 [Thoreauomyces humboldtii]|nr:hypothetical protein HKX48_006821 [Thoreauomyces humboldtii]